MLTRKREASHTFPYQHLTAPPAPAWGPALAAQLEWREELRMGKHGGASWCLTPLLLFGEGWEWRENLSTAPQQGVNAWETSQPFSASAAVQVTMHSL